VNNGELILLAAVPVFVLSMVVEALVLHHGPRRRAARLVGYHPRDSATNLTMGLGNLVALSLWKVAPLALWAVLYDATPLRLGSLGWQSWGLLLVLEDLCYYGFHRAHHEIRLFWTAHVTHHSSQTYNLSTALRQEWLLPLALPFWLPLAALGFSPVQIASQQAISLVYQFFLHTERIGTLGPLELVLNTPSHHRVHHGSNRIYLDRNYGGILIIWDRLFGTFEPEGEPVVYGLTKNLTTHNPLVVAFGEARTMVREVRSASTWRHRLGHVFAHPGWRPSQT
jgi:sterol desaturase/sphingolipid hydroxylase (fatty acid hydroxylase superfamily)